MKIADYVVSSSIYGPGERYVIWTQGCSIRCRGCWNSDMWEFTGGRELSVSELIELIEIEGANIEGVTILGGEPFEQFNELLELVGKIKGIGLTVMLYTGYEVSELKMKGYDSIFNNIDILITGRYYEELRNINRQWIGSVNQEIHFLSEQYSHELMEEGNYIEINIDEWGGVEYLGYPDEFVDKK